VSVTTFVIPFHYGSRSSSGSGSGSGTVINYDSGSDFLAHYGSGSITLILISFIDSDNLCNKNKETVVHEQLNCI
jgi:hypothetical protein